MRIHALATDYDGTLAHGGRVSASTRAALGRAHESGRRLLLVSGRELEDLRHVFPDLSLFDVVVAENGAVLFDPARQESRNLAEPPPPELVSELRRRQVPLSAGRIILATSEPHEIELLRTIRDLGLEWDVVFNKGSVMALPPGVNKASGLRAALDRLHLSPHSTAGIGDAENDHSFLRICEVAVAVGNALPSIKRRADLIMRRHAGRGVEEFIDGFLLNDLAQARNVFARYAIELGRRVSGAAVSLPLYDSNTLILGSSGSGKSALSGLIVEQLTNQGYQACVVDPEGDHGALDPLVVVGSTESRPAVDEIAMALDRSAAGIVINLVSLRTAEKAQIAGDLLSRIVAFQSTHGRPRLLLLDEAHHLLPAGQTPGSGVLPADVEGVVMVTLGADALAANALAGITHLLIVGDDAAGQARAFAAARGLTQAAEPSAAEFELLEGEAVLLTVSAERLGRPQRFRVAERRSEHRRHVRKYAQGDLGPDVSFYFRGREGRLNLRAYNVHAFCEMARGVDPDTWMYHLQRGDLSEWFAKNVKDSEAAAQIREVEARAVELGPVESRDQVLRFVEARYSS